MKNCLKNNYQKIYIGIYVCEEIGYKMLCLCNVVSMKSCVYGMTVFVLSVCEVYNKKLSMEILQSAQKLSGAFSGNIPVQWEHTCGNIAHSPRDYIV